MLRRRFLVGLITLSVLCAGLGGALWWLLGHVPEAYEQAAMPAGPERTSLAGQFLSQVSQLANWVRNRDDPRYLDECETLLTDKQINSYLAEDGSLFRALPAEIQDPRVVFHKGGFTIAFSYRLWFLSTVISLDAKSWISKQEPNVVVVEIERLRAGAIPLSPKMMQEFLSDAVRKQGTDIQWFRNQGNPVAVIRLQANKRSPDFLLDELELAAGSLTLKCRRPETGTARPARADEPDSPGK